MPDITLVVRELKEEEEAKRLERAIKRLDFVGLVNADPQKGLLAVSYTGEAEELHRIETAIEEAGYSFEIPPGAGKIED